VTLYVAFRTAIYNHDLAIRRQLYEFNKKVDGLLHTIREELRVNGLLYDQEMGAILKQLPQMRHFLFVLR